MPFFNPFKSNYVRIAENTVKYYMELKQKHEDRFGDEASILATAGVLDAQNYIFSRNPQISIETLMDLAKESVSKENGIANAVRDQLNSRIISKFKRKKINSVDFLTGNYKDRPLYDFINPLSDFIISLEFLLFKADTTYSNSAISFAIGSKLDSIIKSIAQVQRAYKTDKIFALATYNFMNLPQSRVFRQQLGIKQT